MFAHNLNDPIYPKWEETVLKERGLEYKQVAINGTGTAPVVFEQLATQNIIQIRLLITIPKEIIRKNTYFLTCMNSIIVSPKIVTHQQSDIPVYY